MHSSKEDTKVTQGYEGINLGNFADKIQYINDNIIKYMKKKSNTLKMFSTEEGGGGGGKEQLPSKTSFRGRRVVVVKSNQSQK